MSLVRSKLTYCSQLWRPHTITDITSIESVQCRATKYILNDYKSDYKQRLIASNLLPMMYWLEIQDILFLIKCLQSPHDNFQIRNYISFTTAPTRQGSACKFQYKFEQTNTTRHFYTSIELYVCGTYYLQLISHFPLVTLRSHLI